LKTISPEKVYQKICGAGDFVLIDTLTEDHFLKAHLPGAVNACVFEVVFAENVKKIVPDKNKEIIVYGSSGKSLDAPTAAEKLEREGYRNVLAMEGGLEQWAASGLEVAGSDPRFLEQTERQPPWRDAAYSVDIEKSIIEWTGRNPNGRHYGTIRLAGGEIAVKSGQISGAFEIDMKSIRNIDLEGDPLQPVLISHLMSDDFFFVKMFPKATFSITLAQPIKAAVSSEPNFDVQGLLELRGVKKDVHFLANASGEQGGEVKIEAHFDMDRTRWGVIYGSTRFFEHLGMHLVFDFISIQLCLVAWGRCGSKN